MIDKEKLYEEFHMKVLHFIQGQVNDYYLAEDLCSDVFVKVYEKLDSFDKKKASLSTWIFTITRNKLIDYYRTRKVNEELPQDLTYEIEEDEFSEEDLAKLAEALKGLDERSKKLIVMHYYNNQTLKEIAQELGISYPYVKILHAKALGKLKNFFN